MAGVSPTAPYRHFASREALLAAVLVVGFKDFAKDLDAARRTHTDEVEALVAAGLALVLFAAEHPLLYRLMFGVECDKLAHPELLEAGQEGLQVLVDAVIACKAAGLLGDESVEQVVLTSWSLVHGFASLYIDGALKAVMPIMHLRKTADALIRVAVYGALPNARAAG
ncbi:MAG: TetR-like C-terminal domain-containing protein [Polaromonas sp.]|nr:TetR-like C-terminal domain-containing protein [Polaromonas sp.]